MVALRCSSAGIQRQQLIKRPENCRPCHSKNKRRDFLHPLWLLSVRPSVCLTPSVSPAPPFFFIHLSLFVRWSRGNKSLALVAAQGHTMQCDRYYQIVTKINLESLGLRLTGKSLLNFLWSVPDAECRTLMASGFLSGAKKTFHYTCLVHFCHTVIHCVFGTRRSHFIFIFLVLNSSAVFFPFCFFLFFSLFFLFFFFSCVLAAKAIS